MLEEGTEKAFTRKNHENFCVIHREGGSYFPRPRKKYTVPSSF